MIVSDASPLIQFAKVGRLNLLVELFGKIIIEQSVEEEVVIRGLEGGHSDAILVKKYIEEGKIIVKRSKKPKVFRGLHEGESKTISLAGELKISEVLMDEEEGRVAAKSVGLIPRGTLFVLVEAVRKGKIQKKDAKEIFSEMLNNGFRLSANYAQIFLDRLEELDLVNKRLHVRSEEYAYKEIKEK
ncbi:DUF3368 domain-containing protein [Candidatus Micrarchaeota archaeon]|nr:DUF3368 domain-containing protein [Candidatus Micrarchaeota archaeon]